MFRYGAGLDRPLFLIIAGFYAMFALMKPEIVFVPSAFKHGVTQEDIHHAYSTIIYEGPIEGYENKHAFIGFNRAGNPIEVFYNPIGDDKIKIFHAMGSRDGILNQMR